MLLLTQDLRARLIANGKSRGDHVPVVKFFNPVGSGTWLFSELDEDGDILFGLCDLCFEGRFPLTIYADAARLCGGITEDEVRLEAAAIAIANENSELPQP